MSYKKVEYERIVLTSYMVGFCNFNMYADDDEVYNLTERTTRSTTQGRCHRAEVDACRLRILRREYIWESEERQRKACVKVHSESLAELSSELDSAEECSLSSAGPAPFAPPPDARPPCSKDFSFSSSARIFFVSTSSSMLFRFSPPVPVPLPVRGRLTGGLSGRITKL